MRRSVTLTSEHIIKILQPRGKILPLIGLKNIQNFRNIFSTPTGNSKFPFAMSDAVNSGLLGLDRKAMEEERLARVRARRGPQPSSAQTPAQITLNETTRIGATSRSVTSKSPQKRTAEEAIFSEGDRSNKVPRFSGADSSSSNSRPIPRPAKDSTTSNSADTGTSASSVLGALEYPKPTVKRTHAAGHISSNTVTLASILQLKTLRTAVISSWQMDFDYLLTQYQLDVSQSKFIFVLEAKTIADQERWRADFAGTERSVRLCFPPMSGNLYARMHSKLMLLFHPTHLRIVVPSANVTRHDWGESGLLENMVFVVDLPRLNQHDDAKIMNTGFRNELLKFLEASNIPEDVRNGIGNFDFGATKDVAFIHSIPGTYEDDRADSTGVLGLSRAIKELGCASLLDTPFSVDIATASLGSLDDKQISTFSSCLRGLMPSLDSVAGNTSMNIVYPSLNTVRSSKGGENVLHRHLLCKCSNVLTMLGRGNDIPLPICLLKTNLSTRPALRLPVHPKRSIESQQDHPLSHTKDCISLHWKCKPLAIGLGTCHIPTAEKDGKGPASSQSKDDCDELGVWSFDACCERE